MEKTKPISPQKAKNTVHFYFSFRSPYAWLAFYRLSKIAGLLPVNIDYIPIFPASDAPAGNPKKMAYVAEDIGRFVNAYGLTLHWPKPFDTDWRRPHTSFLYALDQGCPIEFGLAAFAARFSQGRDIGEDNTLAEIAKQCGLQPNHVIRKADDASLQRRVIKGVIRSQREDVFGVPFFVYGGNKYWGNDRLEWLLRDIYRGNNGLALPFMCPSFYPSIYNPIADKG